ncbi:hypothetical protein K1X22_09080 [Mycolicibacterium farcinogenes]|uniref:hypothetical protein n=1 Tax=Mycolicibacterium farcinogenes TaxID=1802 RepID=UPI001C8D8E11|nr:hypothetical protein [Mycolicibacterium farcinogenes]QZH61836.1 hypothetical protein K1X22_09080 [Mycolicibacterium farcinogenes]
MVYQGGDPTQAAYPYPQEPNHETQSMARRWFRFGVGGTIAAALVAVGAYFGVAALVKDKPFTLAGTLQLNSGSITSSGLPPGFNCAGSGGYSDITPGAPVTVSDEAGTLLAKSTFDGSVGGPGWCALSFSVKDVPAGSKFYRVEVARRGDMSYTEEEARALVSLTLGDAKPAVDSTAPTPPVRTTNAGRPTAGPTPADTRPGIPPAYSTPCTSGAGTLEFSNSAVGSSQTSCAFAEVVRASYVTQPRRGGTIVINAYSPVTGETYRMTCTGSGVVTCKGGNNAIVYLY